MPHFHAVACIDHDETIIIAFGQDSFDRRRIAAPDRSGHLHHKSGTTGAGHSAADRHYFDAIAAGLDGIREVLIAGHGTAKTEFAHYARDHVPGLAGRIAGVEAVDHPSEGELLAFARKFFDRVDRTTPQR